MPGRLQGDVVDAIALGQQALRRGQDLRPGLRVADQQVRRQRGPVAGHLPDMQVVHRGDAGHARQRAADLLVREMRGNAFHQHVRRRLEQAARSSAAPAPRPAATGSDRSASTRSTATTAPATIAATEPSMSPLTCSSAARLLRLCPCDRLHAANMLTSRPTPAMSHHHAAGDRRRRQQPPHRLDGDAHDDGEHQQRVDERGDHLGARVAIARAARGRQPRDVLGEQRDPQRCRIGDHVAGVGEQRQRSCDPPSSRLDQRKADGQRNRDPQRPPFVRHPRRHGGAVRAGLRSDDGRP